MIRTLAFLTIVASASALFGYNPLWNPGFSYFFDAFMGFKSLSRTVEVAQKQNYQKVENPELPPRFSGLDLYVIKSKEECQYLISLCFDETGQVAGVCVNFPKDKMTSHFDMTEQGYTSWTHDSVDHWRTCFFFVSEDKQTRINSADESKLLRDKDLTVQGWNGTMDKIPITSDKIAAKDEWVKQACIIMMGQHYYYNMTPELSCDKPFYPWFPLTDENTKQLTGIGFMGVGKTTCKTEVPSTSAVKMIVPTAPQCLYDCVDKYGAFTFHFYFIDNPRIMIC